METDEWNIYVEHEGGGCNVSHPDTVCPLSVSQFSDSASSRINVSLSKMSKHWELRSLQEILWIAKKGQKPPHEMWFSQFG